MKLNKLMISGLSVLLGFGLMTASLDSAYAAVRDGVVVHVKSGFDEPHSVMMALRMAEIMAEDKDVMMYFDVEGVVVVLQKYDDAWHSFQAATLEKIRRIQEKGVKLYVCPTCLKAFGYTPEEVLDGVEMANKDAFFDFTEGRILTIDY